MQEPRRSAPFIKEWGKIHGQEWKPVAEAIKIPYWDLNRKLSGIKLFTLAEAHDIAAFVRADVDTLFPGGDGIDPRDIRAHTPEKLGVA